MWHKLRIFSTIWYLTSEGRTIRTGRGGGSYATHTPRYNMLGLYGVSLQNISLTLYNIYYDCIGHSLILMWRFPFSSIDTCSLFSIGVIRYLPPQKCVWRIGLRYSVQCDSRSPVFGLSSRLLLFGPVQRTSAIAIKAGNTPHLLACARYMCSATSYFFLM